jgi:hypothetical protein
MYVADITPEGQELCLAGHPEAVPQMNSSDEDEQF